MPFLTRYGKVLGIVINNNDSFQIDTISTECLYEKQLDFFNAVWKMNISNLMFPFSSETLKALIIGHLELKGP